MTLKFRISCPEIHSPQRHTLNSSWLISTVNRGQRSKGGNQLTPRGWNTSAVQTAAFLSTASLPLTRAEASGHNDRPSCQMFQRGSVFAAVSESHIQLHEPFCTQIFSAWFLSASLSGIESYYPMC